MIATIARSALPVLAALSLLAAPSPARAQSSARRAPAEKAAAPRDPAPGMVGRWELGGGIGFAIPFESGLDTGLRLAATGLHGQATLGSGMLLQLGGSVAWTYNSLSGASDGSVNSFDLLPLARLRFTLNPQIFAFADGGLGLAIVRASATAGGITRSSTDAALLVKLGGGLGFDLQPNLALTVEPALHVYAKGDSITQLTLLVGILYRP